VNYRAFILLSSAFFLQNNGKVLYENVRENEKQKEASQTGNFNYVQEVWKSSYQNFFVCLFIWSIQIRVKEACVASVPVRF